MKFGSLEFALIRTDKSLVNPQMGIEHWEHRLGYKLKLQVTIVKYQNCNTCRVTLLSRNKKLDEERIGDPLLCDFDLVFNRLARNAKSDLNKKMTDLTANLNAIVDFQRSMADLQK